MKKIALFLVAVVTLLTACDGGVGNVTMTVKPSNLQLKVGETSRIAVSVTPTGNYEFEWKSLNEEVATVANGVVTGVAIGNTTVEVNIKGSNDVKTINIAVVDVLDAVRYYGVYPMIDAPENTTYYTVEKDGEEIPVSVLTYMFVPDNFYVSAGSFAGGWDYPIIATTSVKDCRTQETDSYIYVWSYYQFAPAATSVIKDVDGKGTDIPTPYYFVSDDFNKDNYETLLYEQFINQSQDETLGEKYPVQSEIASSMYCWSWDDQGNYLVGYPTGEGLIFIPGYPEGDNVFFADIAYSFDVKFFTNAEYYGLDLIPGEDPETGEPVMNFPTDESGMPIIRMAEMTTYHFQGGSVEFPDVEQQAPRAGITAAAALKMGAINRMLLKSISYNRNISNHR